MSSVTGVERSTGYTEICRAASVRLRMRVKNSSPYLDSLHRVKLGAGDLSR